MKIAIGSDHAGFRGKQALAERLRRAGYDVLDFGAESEDSVDYPDYARRVAEAVRAKQAEKGVLVCGTGIGMCIAANKVPGIRAASVWDAASARMAAEHNQANVLCLSGRLFSADRLWRMLTTWLSTPFDGAARHRRRLRKITALERKRRP
jgi:ribose 5-phosphate isomerase B